MAATVALVAAIVGIIVALVAAPAPYLVPIIQKRLGKPSDTPAIVQGQPVASHADDAIDAWRGRALRAEADNERADQRIAELEHRLAMFESQSSND